MYDRLEHALHQWTHDSATGGAPQAHSHSHWIDRDVCPVVDELLQRAEFRQLARWSLDNLLPGCDTDARRLIEELDQALVHSATQLADLLRDLVAETPDELAASWLSQLETIAARPWRDLVSERDYFGPVAELNLNDREAYFGDGISIRPVDEFSPYVNAALRQPGDVIVICMFLRIKHWRRSLRRAWVFGQSAISKSADAEARRAAWLAASPPGDSAVNRLHALTDHASEFKCREAAVSLVQMDAAYRPNARLDFLGDAKSVKSQAAVFRDQIAKRDDVRTPAVVAAALTTLADMYRADVDVDAQIAEAVRIQRLVVIAGRGRREAYWERQRLDIDWGRHERAWVLLVEMAEEAVQTGQGVDEMTDLGISLRDARRALGNLLPHGLLDLLKVKNGVHMLGLPAAEIFLGRFEQRELLADARLDALPPAGESLTPLRRACCSFLAGRRRTSQPLRSAPRRVGIGQTSASEAAAPSGGR